MTDKILPVSGKDAELLKTLERIAIGLERLGDIGMNISTVLQDNCGYTCATIASLHDFEPKAPTKGKVRK